MRVLLYFIASLISFCLIVSIFNWLIYSIIKNRPHDRKDWDLNICAEKRDGGGINADITIHNDLKNFLLIDDIYDLPFQSNSFQNILCYYTLQKVQEPHLLHKELTRIGKNVLYVVPSACEISDSLNIFRNKRTFLVLKREHNKLPCSIKLPLADTIHHLTGHKFQ